MKIEDFNYSNSEITQEIYSAMNSTRFLGVSVCTDPYQELILFRYRVIC